VIQGSVDWDAQPLGREPDNVIARRLGCVAASVGYQRRRRGIGVAPGARETWRWRSYPPLRCIGGVWERPDGTWCGWYPCPTCGAAVVCGPVANKKAAVADAWQARREGFGCGLGWGHRRRCVEAPRPLPEADASAPRTPEDVVADREAVRVVRRRFARAARRLRGASVRLGEVLSLRADGLTLEDVGLLWGVSRERVRQVEARARNLARRALGEGEP